MARFHSIGIVSAISAMLLAGCAGIPRIPYTEAEARKAVPAGVNLEKVRMWVDADVSASPRVITGFQPSLQDDRPFTYLALSGGGGDGAYGAGILNGWTASGVRPSFTVVSGVSTGALMAPFAFLGPAYDETLHAIYTDGLAASLISTPDLTQFIFGDGLFGNKRLLELISRYVDQPMVEAIAKEHRSGRRLFILTTNLDSRRGVLWNIGAIADSGSPNAIGLIRNVLAASASVPLMFSPILIDVQADGRSFQEMHVDGSATSNIFVLPQSVLLRQVPKRQVNATLYIIMNIRVEPEFSVVQDNNLQISAASLNTLSNHAVASNLIATYAYAKTHHINFNMTSIEASDAQDSSTENSFDTERMRMLFDLGYRRGSQGYFWKKIPFNPAPQHIVTR